MKVGFSSIAIHRTANWKLFGYGRHWNRTLLRNCVNELTDSPIQVHSLYLEDNEHQLGVLSLDVLGIDASLVKQLRKNALNELGLENVIVVATHSHSAPPLVTTCRDKRNDTFSDQVLRQSSERLKSAITLAKNAEITCGETAIDASHNRRSKFSEKRTVPFDRSIRVLRFKTDTDTMMLVRYSCHAVCLNEKNYYASSDFVGYLERALPSVKLLFLNGCSGYVGPNIYSDTPYAARDLGEKIARSIADIKFTPVESVLRIARQDVSLRLDRTCKNVSETPIDMISFRVGNVAIVGLPGEPFIESEHNIRLTCHSNDVWVIGYTDGYFGYLIDPIAETHASSGEYDYEVVEAPKLFGYKISSLDTSRLEATAAEVVRKLS